MSRSSVLLLALCLSLAACRKEEDTTGAVAPAAPAAQTLPNPVDPAKAGDVAGTVSFVGTPPQRKKIAVDPSCQTLHSGDLLAEDVVVNPNGTLKNVYVHVKSGLDPSLRFPVPSQPVTLSQQGCTYHPHVAVVRVGQTLNIENNDDVIHNVNAISNEGQGFNVGQPNKGMVNGEVFKKPEVMVKLKCDVHPWMSAYVGVEDHPYAAVTGDDGRFTLKGLPAGTYEIEAWQETYGTSVQKVTVEPGKTATINFSFKAP